MTAGRVLAALTAAAAVGGCIALVLGMSNGNGNGNGPADAAAQGPLTSAATVTAAPATTLAITPATTRAARSGSVATAAAPSSSARRTRRPAAAHPLSTPPRVTTSAVATSTVSTKAAKSVTTHASAATTPPKAPAKPTPTATATATAKPKVRGIALPLKYRTGTASRVITVTSTSRGHTTAHLQAWYKAAGGGWLKYGSGVTAHIGSQGMTTAPSESKSATPMGSFTLTHAFGRDADPGTPLPYLRTTPADWWISQAGPLYNTHQRCSSRCAFNQGAPNEHLYYETPYYDYAVVIDYNTRNTGHVVQGAGSAFFLHVTDGSATAGCVAIPQAKLITLMRWLRPATHPRILIGVR